MPNIFKVTERATEIIGDRFARWYEDLQQQRAEALEAPQRRKREDYERIRGVTGPEFVAAVQAYDAQYGPGEFARQVSLGLARRQRREQ